MDNLTKLVDEIMEHRGNDCFRCVIMIVHPGYMQRKILEEIANCGLECMGIMLGHLVKCHPLVGMSTLKVQKYDEDTS